MMSAQEVYEQRDENIGNGNCGYRINIKNAYMSARNVLDVSVGEPDH